MEGMALRNGDCNSRMLWKEKDRNLIAGVQPKKKKMKVPELDGWPYSEVTMLHTQQ